MKIIKKIVNNVPVTIIKTDKFKSVSGTLYFKSLVNKKSMTLRSVLRGVLMESCNKYDTREKLYINTLENYDARYGAGSTRYGNYIINTFSFSSLLDKYTVEGNINNVIDTFCEIVFNPLVKEGKFDKETFDIIVNVKKSDLERIKEDSGAYAEMRAFKNLNQDKPYTYISEIEYLDKLTPEALYNEYLNMINDSEVKLIIAGNIDENDSLIDKITSKIVNNKKYDKSLIVNNDDEKDDLVTITEKGSGTQNILNIIMYLKNTTDYELNYVAPIYRIILGGGSFSRLFSIIREKNSLAYYAFARLEKDDSLMEVIMGIEKENYDKARKLTYEVIESMKEITEDEIEEAKFDIISSIKESQDRISNVVGREHNAEVFGLPDIDEFITNISSVTKEEVEAFGSKLNPNLCFFLKGESNNG